MECKLAYDKGLEFGFSQGRIYAISSAIEAVKKVPDIPTYRYGGSATCEESAAYSMAVNNIIEILESMKKIYEASCIEWPMKER